MADSPSSAGNPAQDWERNLDPTRSFAEFNNPIASSSSSCSSLPSSGTPGASSSLAAVSHSLDTSLGGPTFHSQQDLIGSSSALGFMPYFPNDQGLQLNAQSLLPFSTSPHHLRVQDTLHAGKQQLAPPPTNPAGPSSSYSPSPLGAAVPWFFEGPSPPPQDEPLQLSSWSSQMYASPSTSTGPTPNAHLSMADINFASPSTGPQLHPIPPPNSSTATYMSDSTSNDSSSVLDALAPYLATHDTERFLDQVNTHLSQARPMATWPHQYNVQIPHRYSQYPSPVSTPANGSASHGSPYPDPSGSTSTAPYGENSPISHHPLADYSSSEHTRRASYPFFPAGAPRTFSSLPASPGSTPAYAPTPEFAQAVTSRQVPSGLPSGSNPLTSTQHPLVSRTRNPTALQTRSPRSRQSSHGIWPSPKGGVRPLATGLTGSPHTPGSPRTLPLSPVTPVMESFYDPNCPTVLIANANRALVGATPSVTPSPSSTPSGTPIATIMKDLPVVKLGKVLVESDAQCMSCQRPLATLVLRGKEEQFRDPYHPEFICFYCQPPLDQNGVPKIPEVDEKERDEITYEKSVSALLDRLAGLEIQPTEEKPPQGRGKIALAGNKKRKVDVEPLTCDVCQRDLATGGLFMARDHAPVEFMIEVVCVSCAAKYQRCSDCGGGGGGRVGIGKWRCKELFRDGRRNCTLSHVRQGPHDAQSYEIWAAEQVPPDELEELIAVMRDVVISAILSMGAIPDILEAPTPLARTFEELQRVAVDSWSIFEPLARTNEEETRNIRRYYALRWTTPHKRKKKGSGTAMAGAEDGGKASDDAQSAATTPETSDGRVVMRKGKTLASFIFGELDLNLGSAFPMLVMPKGIGDAYDQNTILMQKMLRRMEEDIAEINSRRMLANLPLWPPLDEVWTMVVFKKESSFLNRTGARRGFLPLKEYLADRPDREHHFPPHRACYLPPELTRGWVITARAWDEHSDLLTPSGRNRRKGESAVLIKGRELSGMVSSSPSPRSTASNGLPLMTGS